MIINPTMIKVCWMQIYFKLPYFVFIVTFVILAEL